LVPGKIPAGHWTGTFQEQITSTIGGHGISGSGSGPASGPIDLVVSPKGTVTGTFSLNGSYGVSASGNGASGTGAGTYAVSNAPIGGNPSALSVQGTGAASGTITITSPVNISQPFSGSDPAIFKLSPGQTGCTDVTGTITGPIESGTAQAGVGISGQGTFTLTRQTG